MSGIHETTLDDEEALVGIHTMHAVRAHERGGPEVLVYERVPLPLLESGEVLVQVRAVGITPSELTWNIWERPDGTSRLPVAPGHEVAGVVVAVAPDVFDVTAGIAVFGLVAFDCPGAAAEYAVVRATDLAPMPRSLSFAQAAATPLSALTAWQALVEHGHVRAEQRVLIHGAAGGVGTFAVQIARHLGAYVIGTASARDAAFLHRLGCEKVIDYTAQYFEDAVRDVDLVLDTVGGDTTMRSRDVLRPGGMLVTIAAPLPPGWSAGRDVRGLFFVVQPNREQLMHLTRLIDQGIITPVVEAVVPLSDARGAYERGLHHHPRGKLVLHVGAEG